MARAAAIQSGFNNGEISPYMYGRVDVEKYPLSLRECTNMRAVVQGPTTKRDGTRFVAPVADETQKSRLFEFEFNPTQGYAIEVNGNRARFFTNRGLVTETSKSVTSITQANPAVVTCTAHGYSNGDQVLFPVVGPYGALFNQVFTAAGVTANTLQLSGYNGTTLPAFSGSPTIARVYSVPAPYASADLPTVQGLHAADVLNLFHGNYQPQKLTRSGATNWAFVPFVFKDGPYLTENPQGVSLTPSDTGSLSPQMASNTTAAPPSVVGWNVYVGTTSGSETLQNSSPIPSGTAWVEPTTGLVAGAAPPGVNTAGISPPTNGALTQTSGGTLAATTYYVVTTWVNNNGETLASTETSFSVILNDVLNVAAPSAAAVTAGVASTSYGSANDYLAFNRNLSDDCVVSNSGAGFVRYYTGGVAAVVDSYRITSSSNMLTRGNMFTAWTFQGSNNGTTWATLDSRSNETGWLNSETRYYSCANETAYTYYQIKFTGGSSATAGGTEAGEVSFHVSQQTQAPITLTASGTIAINGGQGFLASDVGRSIRIMGSDARWRWCQIVSIISPTVITVQIAGQSLPDTTAITRWRLGLFSNTTGWPTYGCYYQDRLCLTGPPSYPNFVCFSYSGVYDTFTPSEIDGTVTAADGFAYQLIEREVTAINWMQPMHKGLVIGTAEGEAILMPMVTSFTTPTPFSALNFKAVFPTNHGSAPGVRPQQVDTVTLFVDRRGKRLRELAYDLQNDSFVAPNMSAMADHITQNGGITRNAWQRFPDRTFWGIRGDGCLLGFTYERDQSVNAWHKHFIAGFSGANGVVEDCAVISSPDGKSEDLWLVVNRGSRRYVEYIGDWFWHDTAQADACFVDASVKYVGSPVTTVGGLAHLEGQTVRILADGMQPADQVVTGGSITLPNGVAASTITVGLPFKGRIWTLRPNVGAQNGTSQGKFKKVYKYIVRLYKSLGGLIGDGQGRLNQLPYWPIANSFMQALGLFSGDIGPLVFPGGWELDGGTVFENDTAYPFTIIAYMPQLTTEDA